MYIYESKKDLLPRILDYSHLDFFFPKKHFYNVGWTVEGYSFNLENAPTQIKNILKLTNGLINAKNSTEHIDAPTKEIFEFNIEIEIKKLIKKYKELPTKKFINESYFLYDKSNLIKKTFISAIQKQLSLYGSFSYFSGDTTTEILNLIEPSNFIKFFIEKKKVIKDNVQLHLALVNGSNVDTKDKTIHNFSITKLGKRRKMMSQEPIDTIIIRAQ